MKGTAGIHIPSSWRKLAAGIRREKGIVMVLGGVDTGKTFLCHYLIEKFAESGAVTALVDGDIGQSTIGPPATIGTAVFKKAPKDFKKVKPAFMRFVGSTSPVGHLLQTLTGVKKMVEKALHLGAELVVVDTTGFVEGNIARELKFQMIDLVGPRHIVAIERESELDYIIRSYARKSHVSIHRLKPAKGVRAKTQSERQKNRERKFCSYFEGSQLKTFHIARFTLHGIIHELTKKRLTNLLIAFCDRHQDVLALGVIEEFRPEKATIAARTPLKSMRWVNSIQFGTLAIKASGEQVQYRRR